MNSLLTREISGNCSQESSVYDEIVDLLAILIEEHLAQKPRRYVVVRKPRLDADKWLRRQLQLETYLEMEFELTAEILGTKNFTRIA